MIKPEDLKITDGKVLIRPFRDDDVEAIYRAVRESMRELLPRMAWCRADYTVRDAALWVKSSPGLWARGTEYHFAITDAGNGDYLGGCGLNRIDRSNGLTPA